MYDFYRRKEQGIFIERKLAFSGLPHESCGTADSDLRKTPYKDLRKSCLQFMAVLKPNETVCLVPFEHCNCCFEMGQCMDFCRTEGFLSTLCRS